MKPWTPLVRLSGALFALALTGALHAAYAAHAAHASQSDVASDRTLAPYFVVSGAAPGVDALPLKSTRADVKVNGVIADVRLTQVYRNDGELPINARYVFPASTRAAVHAMTMTIGERVVHAQIREKSAARAEFVAAQNAGKSASLLEQQRPNVFQMALANVLPGDEVAVELAYTEIVVPTDGVYRFVLPTVVGPRYNGPGGAESHRAETWIAQPTLRAGVAAKHSASITLDLQSPLPVHQLSSPSHPIETDGVGSRHVRLQLPSSALHADRDFVIEYRLAGREIAAGVLLHEGPDENHFIALIEPPARVTSGAIVPREYIFILDVSGSMHGFPIATAKSLLSSLVANLRPTDSFNVIPFAGGHSKLAPASVPATPDNIAKALRFIDMQQGRGSTELLAALRAALAMPAESDRARTFAVITDGYVTIEKQAFELVRAHLGDANVFAFGIGSSVNRHLIEGLARAGRGESFVVLHAQHAAAEAERFRRYIETPVATRLRVAFDGFDAYDVDPLQVPDLFAARPIVIAGKFRGPPSGTIEVSGVGASGVFSRSIDVEASRIEGQDTRGLKYLWARSRIATLADDRRVDHGDALVGEITALGLKYNLLTDYTSFIAVDQRVRHHGGAQYTVDQPQPLPAGVSELAVGAVPSTPEPEFISLTLLGGGLAWWLRRRRQRMQVAHGG